MNKWAGISRENEICFNEFYVYWTGHHLDSWIKRDQLDATCFIISLFNVQHVSDVNTPILRILRLICWVISWVVLLWFDVCCCYVVVWLGWCGVVSVHIEPEQYNPWKNSTNKSQAPENGCIISEICWTLNNEIGLMKQVTSSWSLFIQPCFNDFHNFFIHSLKTVFIVCLTIRAYLSLLTFHIRK